jgi:DNA-binding protein H-NS
MARMAQIQRQIARLQREAAVLKKKEVGGVVERIRTAIAHYELAVHDLFGTKAGRLTLRKRVKGAGKKAATKKAGAKKAPSKRPPVPIKFRDANGNTWTGRGSRPRWLVAATASGIGKKLEDFAVK